MDDKVRKLLDSDCLEFEWGLLFAEKLESFVSLEAAHKAGESPILGKALADVMARASQDPKGYIKDLPLQWMASMEAIVGLIAENNRRLLEVIAPDLVSHEENE